MMCEVYKNSSSSGKEYVFVNKKIFYNVVKILLGSFIFAISINVFSISNNLGEGGVTGLTMLLYYGFSWSPALTNILFNSALLVIGYKFLGKDTIYYTLVSVFGMSFFLKITSTWAFHTNQTIIAAISAGFLMGLGMGVIMRAGGTTAGSAILAKLMNKYFGWNTSYALLFFDILVVVPSIFMIGLENMLFTIVSLSVSTFILNFILEGSNPKKAITIISDKHEEIASKVTKELDRGITVVPGYGYYQGADKTILYIVVSNQQLLEVYKIINEFDEYAFVIVNEVQHVIGEGFTRQIYED